LAQILSLVPTGWYIIDKFNGSFTELSNGGTYTFANNTNYHAQRFVLHFNKNGKTIDVVTPGISAWGVPEGIEVSMNGFKSLTADILVSNLLGQVLYRASNVSTAETYTIAMQNISQVYLITVITPEKTQTIKVVR
jgi:hypothetical protein